MALSKKDISQIAQLFNDGFSQLINPRLESLEESFDRMQDSFDSLEDSFNTLEDKVDNNYKKLKKNIDDNFFNLYALIERNTANIGYYFEKCATKEQYKDHEIRISQLEQAV